MTTPTNARIASALDRVAAVMEQEQKRKIKEEAAQKKAVMTAFEAWLSRAPLAERRAFLEALALVNVGAAARIKAYIARTTIVEPSALIADSAVRTPYQGTVRVEPKPTAEKASTIR